MHSKETIRKYSYPEYPKISAPPNEENIFRAKVRSFYGMKITVETDFLLITLFARDNEAMYLK